MEDISSSTESETNSEELSREVEHELYSVLHHNDFSQGIPPELLEKYDIICRSEKEFVISFKNTSSGSSNAVKEDAKSEKSSRSSSPDVVVLDSDSLETSPAKHKRTERVFVEYSDDDDSSVEIIEMPKKRKISDSVISLTSSSTNDENSLSLNTTENITYDSDTNVSDVVKSSNFKWEHVASPSTWTKEMRKYYNSPCKSLRYFNHEKIRQEIRNGNRGNWFVSHRDLHPDRRPQRRCAFCRQVDHAERNCPKLTPTCHMCGTEGHSSKHCPESICLQCGQSNPKFSSSCGRCTYMRTRECFKCKQIGHESRMCPEKWREFHSTIAGPLYKSVENSRPPNSVKQCCNCASTEHWYEQCTQEHFNPFSPFAGKRGESFDSKRGGGVFNGGPPRKRPKKRRKGLLAARLAGTFN